MLFPLVASACWFCSSKKEWSKGGFVSMLLLLCFHLPARDWQNFVRKNSREVSGQTFHLSHIPYLLRVVRLLDNVCKVLQNPWMKSSMNVKNGTKSKSRTLNTCVQRWVRVPLCACLSICTYAFPYTFRNTAFRNLWLLHISTIWGLLDASPELHMRLFLSIVEIVLCIFPKKDNLWPLQRRQLSSPHQGENWKKKKVFIIKWNICWRKI